MGSFLPINLNMCFSAKILSLLLSMELHGVIYPTTYDLVEK